jgi:hypothetical protein
MPKKGRKTKQTNGILDAAVEKTEEVVAFVPHDGKSLKKTKEYWHNLGPGLTTGASDDDPSGIATYSQTGAQFGFQLLWLSVVTFPLMSVVQEMCARIGLVTGAWPAPSGPIFQRKFYIYVLCFYLRLMPLTLAPI